MTGKMINIVKNGVSCYVIHSSGQMLSVDLIRGVEPFDNKLKENEYGITLKGTDNSSTCLVFDTRGARDSAVMAINTAVLTEQKLVGRVVHAYKRG
ncbi:MAG: hypothetical protein QM500_08730 [Methylococcales bacterium]